MYETRESPVGGILMPRKIRGGQANPAKVRALRENMQPAVSTVLCQVPRNATFSRSFLPSDMETLSDQLAGQSGQLVAIYSLLVQLERAVMVIPFEWNLPPEWVFEQVAGAWEESHGQHQAVYTEDPTGQVPFPMARRYSSTKKRTYRSTESYFSRDRVTGRTRSLVCRAVRNRLTNLGEQVISLDLILEIWIVLMSL